MPQAQWLGGLLANLSIVEEIVPSCGFRGKLHSLSTEHQGMLLMQSFSMVNIKIRLIRYDVKCE